MIKLLEDTANEGLTLAKDILARGEHMLGNMWTGQLTQPAAEDLNTLNAILPGLVAQSRAATAREVALLPQLVDPELLEGTTVNFSHSLIRLAWMLQHAETILPMAGGEIQAAGVSDSHAWVFCGRRPLPFGGSHLRLPSGPAGIRTTTGSLSALARPTPYQLSHRVAQRLPCLGTHVTSSSRVSLITYWGGPPLGVQILYLSNPKNGHETNRTI